MDNLGVITLGLNIRSPSAPSKVSSITINNNNNNKDEGGRDKSDASLSTSPRRRGKIVKQQQQTQQRDNNDHKSINGNIIINTVRNNSSKRGERLDKDGNKGNKGTASATIKVGSKGAGKDEGGEGQRKEMGE